MVTHVEATICQSESSTRAVTVTMALSYLLLKKSTMNDVVSGQRTSDQKY